MNRQFWRKVWRFRELFLILAWRDFSVRYKQTVVGLGWAVLKPLATVIVLTIVFGNLANLPAPNGIPYPILVFSGLLAWNLFSNLVGEGGGSLLANANLISKIYFPRILIPASALLVAAADFAINLVVLFFVMAIYLYVPDWHIVFLPFFVVLGLICGFGPALWLAALTVKYRDLRNVWPFAIQLGLYVSPIGFSSSVVPEKWRLLYSLNPIVGVVDGFRWCLLRGEGGLDLSSLGLSVIVAGVVFWSGLLIFRKTERTFADLI
jgi:lipopolysaccharide transport system permease protein